MAATARCSICRQKIRRKRWRVDGLCGRCVQAAKTAEKALTPPFTLADVKRAAYAFENLAGPLSAQTVSGSEIKAWPAIKK